MRHLSRSLVLFIVVTLAGRGADAGVAFMPLEPTEFDQYLLELTNRARANPDEEAARFGIDLNEGLTPGTIASGPRQPLVLHGLANRVANRHTADILATMTALPPDHRGSDGRDPGQRLTQGGVVYSAYSENNSWAGASALTAAAVDQLHLLLFKDFTSSFEVVGRGHRKVILNGARNQIGIAVLAGLLGGKKVSICTEDYLTTTGSFITGVVYSDVLLANGFYTPGEGLRNVQVRAVRASDALTVTVFTGYAGGFALPVPAGTWDVTASLGQLAAPMSQNGVVVGTENVKVDFRTQGVTPLPMPKFTLLAGGGKVLTGGGFSLALGKVALCPGTTSISESDLDQLVLTLDGVPFFAAANRTVVKKTLDVSGNVVKAAITDDAGNKLTLDFLKRTMKAALKSAPGIDPGDGQVAIELSGGSFRAVLTATSVVAGTKLVLRPASGELLLLP